MLSIQAPPYTDTKKVIDVSMTFKDQLTFILLDICNILSNYCPVESEVSTQLDNNTVEYTNNVWKMQSAAPSLFFLTLLKYKPCQEDQVHLPRA